jgi:hypothetical protein
LILSSYCTGSNTAHGSGWQDSIGKKVKKTFTAMSEPPGDRGKERVSRLQNTQGLAHDEQRDNQLTGADNGKRNVFINVLFELHDEVFVLYCI